MPAIARPRARSGGVQNKCEVKKLMWWKAQLPSLAVCTRIGSGAELSAKNKKRVKMGV